MHFHPEQYFRGYRLGDMTDDFHDQIFSLIIEIITRRELITYGEIHDRIYPISEIISKMYQEAFKAYKQGAIGAINAIVLDEKGLPEGFEKVKSVQMQKAKEFLKDL